MFGIIKKIDRFWLGMPIWAPLAVIALSAGRIATKPGFMPQLIGTKADFDHPVTVEGAFERKSSYFDDYTLRTTSDRFVRLVCEPNAQKQLCLDRIYGYGRLSLVEYAPAAPRLYNSSDGIIIKISDGSYTLYSRDKVHSDMVRREKRHQFVNMALKFLVFLGEAAVAFAGLVVAIGIVSMVRRIVARLTGVAA